MTTTAVLTAKGRDLTTAAMQAGTIVPKVIGWGTNPKGLNAASSDVGMYTESAEARVTGTASVVTTTTANDTYQVVGTITSSSTQTIAEVLIADSTTKPQSTTWATAPTTTSGTTATLTSGTGLVSGVNVQTANGEVITLTTVSGTSVTGAVRGANGSTAATQTAADVITLGAAPGVSVTGGNTLMHATFTGLALNSGDSIAFTCQIKWT
jgi:hypothetical protein